MLSIQRHLQGCGQIDRLVAFIGGTGHGRTTLASALMAVQARRGLAEAMTYAEIAKCRTVRDSTLSICAAVTELPFHTGDLCCRGLDMKTHRDVLKVLITMLETPPSSAVLVVDPAVGLTPEARDQLGLAAALGVRDIVVFFNLFDGASDEEFETLIREEVANCLGDGSTSATRLTFLRGNAKAAYTHPLDPQAAACIGDLVAAFSRGPKPYRQRDKPFLAVVSDCLGDRGEGLEIFMAIKKGVATAGMAVDIIGCGGELTEASIARLSRFCSTEASAGDYVSCCLRGIADGDVRKCHVLAQPGSAQVHREFDAEVYFLAEDEGGRAYADLRLRQATHFNPNPLSISFHWECPVPGRCPEPDPVFRGGQRVRLTVHLDKPIVMDVGDRFVVCLDGRTSGVGVVTAVHEAA